MKCAKAVDVNVLELQGKAIDLIVKEVDRILSIVYEQQEEIECLYACIDELEKLMYAKES